MQIYIKPSYIHGYNTLLTRLNLNLYALKNITDEKNKATLIKNSSRDLKILQRRIDNIFQFISFEEGIMLSNISLEGLLKFTQGIHKSSDINISISAKHLNNYYIKTNIDVFSKMIEEAELYLDLYYRELISVEYKLSKNKSEIIIILNYRNDELGNKIDNDMKDEQDIRIYKIIEILNMINWKIELKENTVELKSSLVR